METRKSMQSTAQAQIIFLIPIFKQTVWGGARLGHGWNYKIPGQNTGECWGVSAHPSGDCIVREGPYEGERLSELWEKHPALFGNTGLDRFPLLVKIIDAKKDLSIQVHPDDAYAKANENGSLGKTECWYVLDCDENSTLIIGHNAKSNAELTAMIYEGRWKELIQEVPVRKGDFILIEPGTVHSIKGGIMVMEIQQSSDITYRVYDYDRIVDGSPRTLHIDKSIDVITVPSKSMDKNIQSANKLPQNTMNLLCACNCFQVWKADVTQTVSFCQSYPFLIMSVIDGQGTINGQNLYKGDHFILPNGYGQVILHGKMQVIMSTVS